MANDSPPRHVLTWPEANVRMAFRQIPAGSFEMGSRGRESDEEPVHRVQITQDFWMAETPVTQAQFAIWTRAEYVEHKNHFANRPTHPAENMDWHQTVAYCQWLTRTKAGQFPPGFELACLPTEARWEYTCRAGTDTDYHTGDGEDALGKAGCYGEEWDSGSTHPVAQKTPNMFLLYDMHGNVLEWCQDNWDDNAYRQRPDGVRDPLIVGGEDLLRVLRGGSWSYSANRCRSARRDWYDADYCSWLIGFRVCLVRSPADSSKRSGEGVGARETERPRDEGA